MNGKKAGATPYDTIQVAQALVRAGERATALRLLIAAREDWPRVPPDYDRFIGRLCVETGQFENAIIFLKAAKLRYITVPPEVHKLLGSALLEIGLVAEAGQELSLAVDGGENIRQFHKNIAIDEYRRTVRRDGLINRKNIPGFTFTDTSRQVQYVAIPKNACTALKAIFVLNSVNRDDYLASGQSIHDFFGNIAEPDLPSDAVKRVVVLRNPFDRLVSAYLNKIVRPAEFDVGMADVVARVIKRAQLKINVSYDPIRKISFLEFVQFIAQISDSECDPHWMPQCQFTGDNLSVFSHVGRVECLDRTIDYLVDNFHMKTEIDLSSHLRNPDSHITRYDPEASTAEPWNALPEDLLSLSNGFPTPTRFYSTRIRNIVAGRYAADVAMHEIR